MGKLIEFFKRPRIREIGLSVLVLFLLSGLLLIAVHYIQADTELAQEQLLEQVKQERESLTKEVLSLQSQFDEIKQQIDALDLQIQTNIVEREVKHENISNARTIGGVDAVLKHGRSATTVKTRSVDGPRRIDSNPYK